jgi:methylglutaconyl-CoA hydratase
MSFETIKTSNVDGVFTIALNRVEVKNAFNDLMISELTHAIKQVNQKTRIVLIKSEGDTFCSGGDLNWMKKSLSYTKEENYLDAKKLSSLFQLINESPVPVIGAVHRFALGGGVGLVSVCDYVIAEKDTKFSLSEVKLGLIPACIGPFVLSKIGESWARALFLSANRFDTEVALRIGLIHSIANDHEDLKKKTDEIINQIKSSSPQALSVAKSFLREIKGKDMSSQNNIASKTLADIRVTEEAQEGLKAFLEKRSPKW